MHKKVYVINDNRCKKKSKNKYFAYSSVSLCVQVI